MTRVLQSGPATGDVGLILAHGAGAGISSPFLEAMADLLAERHICVTRFEFAYMTARLSGHSRKPPPRAEKLVDEYRAMVGETLQSAKSGQKLFIGGKSLGGRVASLVADDLFEAGAISGLVCLGYPFHPPNKPEQLRTTHLVDLKCPALIVQGERDPFGNRVEVEQLKLSKRISLTWIGDGDHDLGPRGRSGFTRAGNLAAAADAVAAFTASLRRSR